MQRCCCELPAGEIQPVAWPAVARLAQRKQPEPPRAWPGRPTAQTQPATPGRRGGPWERPWPRPGAWVRYPPPAPGRSGQDCRQLAQTGLAAQIQRGAAHVLGDGLRQRTLRRRAGEHDGRVPAPHQGVGQGCPALRRPQLHRRPGPRVDGDQRPWSARQVTEQCRGAVCVCRAGWNSRARSRVHSTCRSPRLPASAGARRRPSDLPAASRRQSARFCSTSCRPGHVARPARSGRAGTPRHRSPRGAGCPPAPPRQPPTRSRNAGLPPHQTPGAAGAAPRAKASRRAPRAAPWAAG